MNDTVFVHAGLAKTGTTTLQQNVFSKTDEVAYLGKNLVPEEVMAENRKLTRLADGRFDAQAAKAVFDAYRRTLPGVAVFSDEDLSVWKFLDPRVMGARIGEIFPACRLIYVTRRPADWVMSQYFFRLWTWRPDTFHGPNGWLDAHLPRLDVGSDVAEIQFTETLRRLHGPAGSPPVLVLPYELMAQDLPGFLGRIEEFMGLDGALRSLAGSASEDPKKVRMSHRLANYVRTAGLLDSDRDRFAELAPQFAARFDREGRRAFAELAPDAPTEAWIELLRGNERAIRRALSRGDEALGELLDPLFDDYAVDPGHLARIEEIAAAETQAMRRDFGVDLTPFGYPA